MSSISPHRQVRQVLDSYLDLTPKSSLWSSSSSTITSSSSSYSSISIYSIDQAPPAPLQPLHRHPHTSRFTEHFHAHPASMRRTNTALTEDLRLKLIEAEETCSAMSKAIVPIALELDEICAVSKALTKYLHNIDHFYTSRGLPPRGLPSAPTDPLDVQAAELRDRVEYLQEHKVLLEDRLQVWKERVEGLRGKLLAACHISRPYGRLPISPPSSPPPLAPPPPPPPPSRRPPPPPI